MEFDKFKQEIMQAIATKPTKWRNGQAVFNYIDTYYGIGREVSETFDIDCFYNDAYIDEFIEKSYKILSEQDFKKVINDDGELFICACGNTEHQMIIKYDREYNQAYISFHLSKLPFFKRIVHGIKYIFGYTSKYGDFDEIIIGKKYAEKFIILGQKLKQNDRL